MGGNKQWGWVGVGRWEWVKRLVQRAVAIAVKLLLYLLFIIGIRFVRQTSINSITHHTLHRIDHDFIFSAFCQMNAWMHLNVHHYIFNWLHRGKEPERERKWKNFCCFASFFSYIISMRKFLRLVAFSCQPNQNLSTTRTTT